MGKQKTHVKKNAVASKGATKATKKETPIQGPENPRTFLNKWGFLRVPKAFIDKLPFKAGEELEIVIGGDSISIFKSGNAKSKITKTETVKPKDTEEFKKCEKHNLDYSDYCPKCKAEEQKAEVPAK